ncbi:MAG TPA: TIGR03085 family metal-binding protein [Geodermatophilus sp.]|nr:TIGR03085 family metal-binding protein [Geodermatophilus sp.]
MASSSLSARERAVLADLLQRLGPDAPTCCAGWRTEDLAAHLVVRDRRPDAGPGFALERWPVGRPLRAWAGRLEAGLRARTEYADLVARVRSGPPGWLPTAWPAVDRLVNTAEFAIHHEDVRRAQPGWTPRALDRADQDALWPAAVLFARSAAGRRPGGLVLRRSDVPGVEKRIGGGPGTTVTGEPLELLLWAAGRESVARVTLT